MSYDAQRAVKFVYDTLRATTPVLTQLTSGVDGVQRDYIPKGVSLPGVAVSMVSEDAAQRPMQVGSSTQTYTMVRVQTKIVSMDNYNQALEDAVIAALDGKVFQQLGDTSYIYSCVKGPALSWTEIDGDVVYRHTDIEWRLETKAA